MLLRDREGGEDFAYKRQCYNLSRVSLDTFTARKEARARFSYMCQGEERVWDAAVVSGEELREER